MRAVETAGWRYIPLFQSRNRVSFDLCIIIIFIGGSIILMFQSRNRVSFDLCDQESSRMRR